LSLAIDHLNQLASRHANDVDEPEQVDLWVPSERVLSFRVELPKVSRRKQQEMLPWLLEDRLLSSPDNFEFILGAQLDKELGNEQPGKPDATETLVYVIEKTVFGQWMLLAEAANVAPAKMAPDFLALPYEDGRWTLYTDEGRLLVRTGVYEGFAANLEFGWQQLELLLAQQDIPIRISHLASSDTTIPENLTDRIDTETGKINWAFTELPVSLDILPSYYRPKRSSSLSVWVPAIAATVSLSIFLMSYMLIQSWAWQRDVLVLEVAVTEAYETLFSKKISGHALNAAESAREHLALLEHQYITSQTSPQAELAALDRVFSTCSDCVLMGLTQTDSGLNIRLKDNARLKSRLDGIDGWSMNWGAPDAKGMSSLLIQRAGQ